MDNKEQDQVCHWVEAHEYAGKNIHYQAQHKYKYSTFDNVQTDSYENDKNKQQIRSAEPIRHGAE